MSHFFSAASLSVCFVLHLASPLQAQFSLKPQPLPVCRTFAITEMGIGYRLTSPPGTRATYTSVDSAGTSTDIWESRSNRKVYVTSDLGLMRNINHNYALGGSLFLGHDGRLKIGARLRVRRWLSHEASVDFSPGVLLYTSSDYYKAPGFTGSVDLKIREWFALTATLEYLRPSRQEYGGEFDSGSYRWTYEPMDDNIDIYLGMRSGSYAGFIAHGAVAVVGIGWMILVIIVVGGTLD